MNDCSIKDTLDGIRSRLPSGVSLVAVSKYRPVEQLQQAYDAGQRVFAESRPVELRSKAGLLPGDVRWHFIGHLQTNKISLVLPYVSLIHSVDSVHLLDAINRFCLRGDTPVQMADVLLEVHVAREQTKQGFSPSELPAALDYALSLPCIRVCGLMGMASHTDDSGLVRSDFRRLRSLFDSLAPSAPSCFRELSMGMSDDWHIAVEEGSTMVRIGSAIFCPCPENEIL